MDKRGFASLFETLVNGPNATKCVRLITDGFVGHGTNGTSPKVYDARVENIYIYDDGIIIEDLPRKRDARVNARVNAGQINEKCATKVFAIDVAIPYNKIIAIETIPHMLAEERQYL